VRGYCTTKAGSIVVDQGLQDYCQAQFATCLAHRHVDVAHSIQHHLSQLLTNFTDSQQLVTRTDHGWDLKPLASHYANTVEADGVQQPNMALKRRGDIALFIAGMSSRSLALEVVDVDYSAAMGGSAYRDLHDYFVVRLGAGAHGTPCAELGARCLTQVGVLAGVAEESYLGARHDLLRDYATSIRANSPRALSSLHRAGVLPSWEAMYIARH
jgi:hypothetical protein